MTSGAYCHVNPDTLKEALPRDGRAPLDVEAGCAAWHEFENTCHSHGWLDGLERIQATVPLRDAVVLACLAYVHRIDARRARWVYPLASGQRIPGVHPGMVAALLSTLHYYGQLEGPAAEDAGARAIAAVFAWMERHEAEDRAHERRHGDHARQVAADLAQARRRAQEWRGGNGGGR
jgi:hypothetical protein